METTQKILVPNIIFKKIYLIQKWCFGSLWICALLLQKKWVGEEKSGAQ